MLAKSSPILSSQAGVVTSSIHVAGLYPLGIGVIPLSPCTHKRIMRENLFYADNTVDYSTLTQYRVDQLN